MATFDEVMEQAVRQLDAQGVLLDRQISQWAQGDEMLVRSIRERLKSAGVAADRYGVGLGRVGKFGDCRAALQDGRLGAAGNLNEPAATSDPDSESDDLANDWWVMTNGNVRGPWSMPRLITMRMKNELTHTDMVREGARGIWLKLLEVQELRDVEPRPATKEEGQSAVDPPALPTNQASHNRKSLSTESNVASASHASFPLIADPTARPAWQANSRQKSSDGAPPTSKPAQQASTPQESRVAANSTRSEGNSSKEFEIVPQPADLRPATAVGTTGQTAIPDRKAPRASWNWSFHSIDSLTSTLAVALPAGFGFAFSREGRAFRRWTLVLVCVCASVVAGWWAWPPSSASIIKEFEAVHLHVRDLKQSRKSDEQMATDLIADRARIQRLVTVLERRASDSPSIHRELLLAGKHGLLVIIDYPRNSGKFEMMFALHMKRAKALLEGQPVEPENSIKPPNGESAPAS